MFKRQSKNPKIKIKSILILFLLILTIGIIYLILKSNFFNIKNLEIKLSSAVCVQEEEIKKSLEAKSLNQNILFFDAKVVQENLKREYICIKSASLIKKIPDRLEATIIGREAKIKVIPINSKEATISSNLENIATPSAKDFIDIFLADGEGKIFSKDPQDNLPIVFVYQNNIQLGEDMGIFAVNILKVLENLRKFHLEIVTAKLVDEFLVTETAPKVVFKLSKDIDAQLASLQLILQQAKIDSNILEFIDLRFDKPVVRFAPKKNG